MANAKTAPLAARTGGEIDPGIVCAESQADYWTRTVGVSWEQLSRAVRAVSERAAASTRFVPEALPGGDLP